MIYNYFVTFQFEYTFNLINLSKKAQYLGFN